MVVTNHGPAVMEKVEVEVFDENGQSLALTEPDITSTRVSQRCTSA